MSSSARDARRLTPVEVATAGALSGLAVTFGLIAAVTPVFQLLFQVATAVPLAMASLKLRPRAAVAAFASTILLAIAVGGVATVGRSFQAALVGLLLGFPPQSVNRLGGFRVQGRGEEAGAVAPPVEQAPRPRSPAVAGRAARMVRRGRFIVVPSGSVSRAPRSGVCVRG